MSQRRHQYSRQNWQRQGAYVKAQQKDRHKRLLMRFVILLVLLCGAYALWTHLSWSGHSGTGYADRFASSPAFAEAQNSEASGSKPGTREPITGLSELTLPMKISEIEAIDTHYLELVNQDHPIDSEPDNSLLEPAWPTLPTESGDILLHARALDALRGLFWAADEANAGTFYLSSGYRDYAEQKQIYNEEPDKSYVQPPNHSEHQTGLAADIAVSRTTLIDLVQDPGARWLANNAWKHGLILRYTEDKREITHIAGEPWHFRYIGQPHAYVCWQNNWCFEEYIQFLKESGGYQLTLDGRKYTVLYLTPINGTVYVPENLSFEISSDNTGGYILTAWE